MQRRILFVTPEYDGLIKVGGLADVSASLPRALAALGHDVRVLLPGYGGLRRVLAERPAVRLGGRDSPLREWRDAAVRVWLYDSPAFALRDNPYTDARARPWADDATAFADFCRFAARVAGNRIGLHWQPDVVHCNDWPTGLLPVQLLLGRIPVASVFTIHNLAYQGLFPREALGGLPAWLFHPEALEYFGRWSFIKGGLNFADRLTTVSPSYAREIQTPAFGEGLDGILRRRRTVLDGILNGINPTAWNPRSDAGIAARFHPRSLRGKRDCRIALVRELGLRLPAETVLAGFVGRLVAQKGADLLLAAVPRLMADGLRLVVLGTGDPALERAFAEAARAHPGQMVFSGRHDHDLARRVFAGVDQFLMPSRFEPCGLAQMYAMRYGAVPVAHATGGLRDSIVPLPPGAQEAGTASGVLFDRFTLDALLDAVARARQAQRQPRLWHALMRNGMRQDFAWQERAEAYLQVYTGAMVGRSSTGGA